MGIFTKASLAALFIGCNGVAVAGTITTSQVDIVDVQGATVKASFTGVTLAECSADKVQFSIDSAVLAAGRFFYSNLLTARSTGRNVTVGYTEISGICTVNYVTIH